MDKKTSRGFFKELIRKPQVKNTILGVLTLIIGGLCSAMGNWNASQNYFVPKIFFIVFFSLAYVSALIFYSKEEVNERKVRGLLERRVSTFEDYMSGLIAICRQNSMDINSCIHRALKVGKIDLNIWSFDKACQHLCGYVYSSLCSAIGNKHVGIAYIKLIEGENPERRIEMNSFANETMTPPNIIKRKRDFSVERIDSYHDELLFRRASTEIDILMTPDEIEVAFAFLSKESRKNNKGKYSQYAAIPVFCNDKKMVGLLEVVALYDAKIGVTKEEVKEIASKFLQPYAYMFLLLHKLEKSLLVGTKKLESSLEESMYEQEKK